MSISDENIKTSVIEQLYWDSRVEASKINVTVKDGPFVDPGKFSRPDLRF